MKTLITAFKSFLCNSTKIKELVVCIIIGEINFWVFGDSITFLLFSGKGFTGRSFTNQVILFIFFSIIFVLFAHLFLYLISKVKGNTNPIYFLISINLWLIVLFFVHRGFDTTDNGYYLLVAHRYEDVKFELTFFGLITRVLYSFSNGSTAIFRIFGAIILMGTSYYLGYILEKVNKISNLDKNVFAVFTPAISATLFYHDWVSTPSYNWLAFLASLWFFIGILLFIMSKKTKDYLISGFVIGFSGFLSFLAKPTTAAGFVIIFIIVIIFESKKFKPLLFFSVGVLLGLIIGLSIPNWSGETIFGTYEKLLLGIQLKSPFGFKISSIFLPLKTHFQELSFKINYYFVGYFFIGIIFLAIYKGHKQFNRIFLLFWISSMVSSFILFTIGFWSWVSNLMTLILAIILRISYKKGFEVTDFKNITRSIYCILIAYSIALGTTNSYEYYFTGIICIFCCSLNFLIILMPKNIRGVMQHSGVLLLIFIVGYQLFYHPEGTYRQDVVVWEMNTPVSIRLGEEVVFVSNVFAKEISNFQQDALRENIITGTPIIDLTGTSPGLVYILDGRSIGTPWFLGGYKYSELYNRIVLGLWKNDDLQKAWILTSDDPLSLPVSLIKERKLDFPNNYISVSSIRHPFSHSKLIFLWKPKS